MNKCKLNFLLTILTGADELKPNLSALCFNTSNDSVYKRIFYLIKWRISNIYVIY